MKIGTIGTGSITDWVMGQLLEYEQNEYTAIYSRKHETAQALAEKYHVDKIYTDLDEMLKDDEIDCIYVASPNSLHFEHAKKAMLANKNVIVEKPFCSNVKECEELIALCRKTTCFLFEAITTVYNPNYLAVKEKLKDIMPVRIVECNMSQYSRKYDAFLEGGKPNVFTPAFSGGALMDINVYNLHFVVGLFGMPQSVHYEANIKEGIDTSGVLSLNYENMVVSCVGSKDNIGVNFCQIQGEKGYIYVEGASSMTKKAVVHLRNGEECHLDLQKHDGAHYYYGGAMLKMIEEKDHESCYKMLEHSLQVMKVIDMAKKSAGIVFDADR
ncbi:Gfo/Idh/MocA family oxidoreductase [uncultured Traorella sp.]|uniref:Gfo/Idh/MocA family protein n=1 Tax=uncultured Traorella sp. TaxID=1929048 RepID=UPI0025F3C78B|nr:Gfo/Idh/MocA family oxidoreductase [uncultured Traorella sp.]